jgi:SAM-dependent methyltransferase
MLTKLEDQTIIVQRVRALEDRNRYQKALIHALLPNSLPISSANRHSIIQVFSEHQVIPDIDLTISKNDLMYFFIFNETLDIDRACFEYIYSGMYMFLGIQEIVKRKWGGFEHLDSFLDFASGYGRLTRFVVRYMSPELVWVSDIKAGAMDFQQQQFNVHTVLSTTTPDDFVLSQHFNCIYVGSLFSHLPQSIFSGWLRKLYQQLAPGGILIFSTLDISLLFDSESTAPSSFENQLKTGHSKDDFIYIPSSEEGMFHTTDNPLDNQTYGITYVTESYIRNTIEQHIAPGSKLFRYPRAWGQDIYLLTNDASAQLDSIQIPRNPHGW